MAGPPQISVITPTRNRADRLRRLADGLARQTVGSDAFEWIVVDDASTDPTADLLAAEEVAGRLDLHPVEHAEPRGPGAARNAGVAVARAPLIAFVDDDCVPDPHWLEAFLATPSSDAVLLQGRTAPDPTEADQSGPFSRSLTTDGPGPPYVTANIVYPRALFERLGGFDASTFTLVGEDMDLALRALEAGADCKWVPDALVHHAVVRLGPVGKLRNAARWTEAMQVYKLHPGMRDELQFGIFWKGTHYLLVRALIAALLPARLGPVPLRPLRHWLASAYLRHLLVRGREEGGGPLAAPYYVLHDVVETVAVARGGLRYRTLIL